MPIIISNNGKGAVRVNESQFEKEGHLQEYIYDNPEMLPLYEIKEDIRFLILARELRTNSGPIDAIGIDKEGDIYIVETKLYKNPDKRTVIAQVLDYGASLWKSSIDFGDFTEILDKNVRKKFNSGLSEKLSDYFILEEEELNVLMENVRKNLNEGKFKFVVLMDKLESRLKDLIIFMNENSKFDIYAVELDYYKHETWEILIPKLFGNEVKKDMGVKSSDARRWDENGFFEDAKKHLSEQERNIAVDLYEFFKNNFSVRFGTGSTRSSFSVQMNRGGTPISLLEITSKGKIQFYLSGLIKRGVDIPEVQELVNSLSAIDSSFAVSEDLAHSYSSSKIGNLLAEDKLECFKEKMIKYRDLWSN
ncbi:MAG: hypothetical protein MCSN_1790 [Candidatus Microsyncoccus archaeolyticus]|nr:MAG: hypothetical protein MCSN_1790 [Candidatus Parcubacteria bacterium]